MLNICGSKIVHPVFILLSPRSIRIIRTLLILKLFLPTCPHLVMPQSKTYTNTLLPFATPLDNSEMLWSPLIPNNTLNILNLCDAPTLLHLNLHLLRPLLADPNDVLSLIELCTLMLTVILL